VEQLFKSLRGAPSEMDRDRELLKQHLQEVADSFELAPQNFFLAKLFGLSFAYGEETCTASMRVQPFMYNPAGIVHGGVISFLADTAMGHLTNRESSKPYVSLEFKVSFMKAVRAGMLHATAFYRRKGNKVVFLDCIVRNEEGVEVAQMTSTYYQLS
jgi:uncharacterized protein (TIGR00369 family)